MTTILFSRFEIAVSNRATCDANLDFLISCFAFTLILPTAYFDAFTVIGSQACMVSAIAISGLVAGEK